jgi:hypothetical protein
MDEKQILDQPEPQQQPEPPQEENKGGSSIWSILIAAFMIIRGVMLLSAGRDWGYIMLILGVVSIGSFLYKN